MGESTCSSPVICFKTSLASLRASLESLINNLADLCASLAGHGHVWGEILMYRITHLQYRTYTHTKAATQKNSFALFALFFHFLFAHVSVIKSGWKSEPFLSDFIPQKPNLTKERMNRESKKITSITKYIKLLRPDVSCR